VDSGEEISGELVVAGGDGAKVFEFVEEAFDEVAFAVEREVAVTWGLAIGFGWYHGGDFPAVKCVDEWISVVGLVADQGLWDEAVDQRLRTSQLVGLPGREHQRDGIAKSVDERVDFGRQSAAGSADRLFAIFFRAPALC
jgi:hypothetical protein